MSPRIMQCHTLSSLVAAGLMVGAGCRQSSLGPQGSCALDNDASVGVQGELRQFSGDGATAQAGAQISLIALLVDVDDERLCDKTITWTPGANSGTVSPGQSTTADPSGEALSVWTLGPATGTQTVTATVENSVPVLSVVFTATATPSGVYRLAKVSGDEQSASLLTVLPQPLVVEFVDVNGNPGPATVLTWDGQGSGHGSLAQASTTTDAVTGLSQNTWTLGSRGAQAVTVSEPGGSSVVFIATFTLGTLAKVSGDHQSAPGGTLLPQPLVVKFANGNGTPGPATNLTWQVSGGGTMDQVITTSDAGTGLSQNNWTLGPAGTPQSVTVSEPGGSSVTFTATATPGGGAHPKAEIRAYNGTDHPGITVDLQTPYDGPQSLGPIAPGFSFPDSLQVEVGVQFTISSTIGGQTGTVTCTTAAAIIPVPGDPMTGNALVSVSLGAGGQPTLGCSGGWH